jgi:OFA family oxalate/formate antiporter-like MFS transporter
MFMVFMGEGLALLGLMRFGHDPYAFMFFAAMVFLCWGEIFSIFPATCADTFGSKYAAANAGALYTAKGTASMLVPLATVLSANGSWNTVFILAAGVSITAALSAKFILAPMRRRWIGSPVAASAIADGQYQPLANGSRE